MLGFTPNWLSFRLSFLLNDQKGPHVVAAGFETLETGPSTEPRAYRSRNGEGIRFTGPDGGAKELLYDGCSLESPFSHPVWWIAGIPTGWSGGLRQFTVRGYDGYRGADGERCIAGICACGIGIAGDPDHVIRSYRDGVGDCERVGS